MGKIVSIAIMVGIAYAWHKGMLGELTGRQEAFEAAAPPAAAAPAEPHDPYKRYENAEETPEQRCAAARAKLEQLEMWARGSKGVIDAGSQNAALDQARQIVEEKCPS